MTQIDHHRMQIADLRINASQPFLQETLLPQLSTFVNDEVVTSADTFQADFNSALVQLRRQLDDLKDSFSIKIQYHCKYSTYMINFA